MRSVRIVDVTLAALRDLDARRPEVLDSVLAALVFLGAAVSGVASEMTRPADSTFFGLVAIGALPYVLRRRLPLTVLVVASIPVLAILSLGYTSAVIGAGLMLAAYSVAAWSGRRQTVAAAVWVVIVLLAVFVSAPRTMPFAELVTNVAMFAGALALGRGATIRRENVALLRERAELAEQARVQESRRAVSDERLRIAQELHDVIGHSLGVIALQSGVGAHVIDTDPAEAKASLLAVSSTSRTALAEVRRILGALRTDDGTGAYRPPPGLESLPELAADLTAAGLPVQVRIEGARTDVPAALDLTAYRLVQEALTNVLRHSGPTQATVTVRYAPTAVEVEVLDDGNGLDRIPVPGARQGYGQLGMRERVTVWGGSLDAGPRPDGGYRVAARLPYGEEDGR